MLKITIHLLKPMHLPHLQAQLSFENQEFQTPRWIAQVSEMLNSEHKNDWRAVAMRIGFRYLKNMNKQSWFFY